MPVIQNFAVFMASGGLVCPSDKKKIEYSVSDEPGLFVECRASATSVPTWYLRQKNAQGTNAYKKLGTIKDLSLSQTRKLVQQCKAEHLLTRGVDTTVKADPKEMTLDTFMRDHYLPHAFLHKRSAKKDEQLYRIHIGPRFKDTLLSQITRRDVQAFHNGLLTKGQSPASADHSLKLMKRVLNLCVQWEYLDRHVLKGVPLFNVSDAVTTFLQEKEIAQLVEVLRTDKNRPVSLLLMFLISVGVRKMTGMLARWDEIDLENRVWKIPATKSKSKRPVSIPLSDSAMYVLGLVNEQLGTKGTYDHLFVNPETGKPFVTVSRVFYRLRKKAGLGESVKIHSLRHFFASSLSMAGVPSQEISLLMTHADSRSVQRYLHVSMPRLQQSANRVSMIVPQSTTLEQLPDAANMALVDMTVAEPKAA